MTATIILFESALELIPEHLRSHPLIKKEWKKGVKEKNKGILLDGAIHRPLFELLEDKNKRGRPDIIHQTLLNVVYSSLFATSKLKVIVHTRNNLTIEIPNDWRIPVNYNRFCGLFSQLLLNNRVPLDGMPILETQKNSLGKLLDSLTPTQVYLCELQTTNNSLPQIHSSIRNPKDSIFLIGGFQEGQPSAETYKTLHSFDSIKVLSLYPDIKPTWIIAGKLVFLLESGENQWQFL